MSELIDILKQEFTDKEYAHVYMQSQLNTRIAAQVHALRKSRGLTQEQLSLLSGLKQEQISKIENQDFDSLTMSTLRKLSVAFDVNLNIEFNSFSEAILDFINLNVSKLEVIPRTQDFRPKPVLTIISGAPTEIVKIETKRYNIRDYSSSGSPISQLDLVAQA